eukprot:s3997_g5.t1
MSLVGIDRSPAHCFPWCSWHSVAAGPHAIAAVEGFAAAKPRGTPAAGLSGNEVMTVQLSEYVLPFATYFAEFLGTFFVAFTSSLLMVRDETFVGSWAWRASGMASAAQDQQKFRTPACTGCAFKSALLAGFRLGYQLGMARAVPRLSCRSGRAGLSHQNRRTSWTWRTRVALQLSLGFRGALACAASICAARMARPAFGVDSRRPVFVVGNEAADVDSLVSAYVMAQLLESPDVQGIALAQIPREEFRLRGDALALFKEAGSKVLAEP